MTCEDYLQDPEANAAHLESCAECRAIAMELDDLIPVVELGSRSEATPIIGFRHISIRELGVMLTSTVVGAELSMAPGPAGQFKLIGDLTIREPLHRQPQRPASRAATATGVSPAAPARRGRGWR